MPRVGGSFQLAVNGEVFSGKGAFDWNLGRPMREAVNGASEIPGYKETPQVAFLEGAITDRGDLDVNALVTATGATVTLGLANGKTLIFRDAWYAAAGTGNTEEGEFEVRFEAVTAEEVAA